MAEDSIWEISIEVPRDMEEIAIAHLAESAPRGFEQRNNSDSTITFVFYRAQKQQDSNPQMGAFGRLIGLADSAGSSLSMRRVEEIDWVTRIRQEMRPIEVGKLRIVPPWFAKTSEVHDNDIILAPGMAFGTGYHESTRVALRLLQRMLAREDENVMLDVGCGSGILAISSISLGVQHVFACDISEQAIHAASENARTNGVWQFIDFCQCDVGDLPPPSWPEEFSLVTANLSKDIFRCRSDSLRNIVAPGGSLIMSGIYDTEVDEIAKIFDDWSVAERMSEGHWHGLVLKNAK